MQIEMKVRGLMVDPVTNVPIVILRDTSDSRVLPIWVGIFEANAIALKVEDIQTPRPMTHDLLRNLLQALEARVERVVVTDLRDGTYYALIHVNVGGKSTVIDSRPSDALALALRTSAPIFVEETVFERAQTGEGGTSEQERLRQWFESLDPQEFSKYEM